MSIREAITEQCRRAHERGRQVDGALLTINTFGMAELLDTVVETEYGTVTIGIDETVPNGEAMLVRLPAEDR